MTHNGNNPYARSEIANIDHDSEWPWPLIGAVVSVLLFLAVVGLIVWVVRVW